MKLAIVPSWYNSERAPSRGGFVRDQALALAARGHNVSIVALDRDADYPLLAVRRSVEHGIPHVRIALPWPWHRILGFYAPFIVALRLAQVLRAEAPDVVHAHAARPAGVLVSLALASGSTPWCITEHSGPLEAFWWTAHGRRQIGRAYKAARRLFGVSRSLIADMNRLFPCEAKGAQVLENGIDTNIFTPQYVADNRTKFRLLFAGGLSEVKGLDCLLQAARSLPPELEWTLSIVGVGPLAGSLRDLALALGIAGKLNWLGAVPHEKMPQIFSEHDLLVVPSKAETFSLVAAEALACGIPVVATRCGGPEEVIGPLGLPLVPVGQPAALAQAMAHTLANLSCFDRAAAVESVRNRFSMKSLAAKLETIYAEMMREAV